MGIKYLWDTNTVVYYLQQHFPPEGERFIDDILEEYIPAISVITEMELLCWKSAVDQELAILQGFISSTLVLGIEKNIKAQTVAIRKSHKTKLPDAIIAATALEYGLTLVTRNTKDFKKIKSLEVIDPFKLVS